MISTKTLRAKREALKRPTFSQEEMEASRQTGFAQGRAEGQRETMASLEAQLRELMQQVNQTAALFMDNENQRLAAFIDQSSLLTTQILVRTLRVLLKSMALEQIEDFVRSTLQAHVKRGALTILVSPEFETPISERVAALKATMPQASDWTVRADPALHNYESRVEWTGGGAEWDPEVVASSALETLLAHLPEHMRALAFETPASITPALDEMAQATVDETAQSPHTEDTGENP